jgi:uncharacterized membrane protein YoaK (UPF0700 family)
VLASLVLTSSLGSRVEVFIIAVSLALGLQNGAFRRVGGISVHTTYLTGMITSLISSEAEKHVSGVVLSPSNASDPKIGLLYGIWVAFVWVPAREPPWLFTLERSACSEPRCF